MPLSIDFNIYFLVLLVILVFISVLNIYFFGKKVRNKIKSKERLVFKLQYLKHYIVFTNLIALGLMVGIFYLCYIRPTPFIISSTPSTESVLESYDEPIEIVFNMPVDARRLIPNMNPALKGSWEWEPYLGISRFTRVGRFYPEETLLPGERIVIYITGIGRVGYTREGHEGGIVMDSALMPEVIATNPFHNKKDITVDSTILLLFNKPFEHLADIKYSFVPEIEFTSVNESERLVRLTPVASLDQSMTYELNVSVVPKRMNLKTGEVSERDNPQLIQKILFSTVKEPFIKSIAPKGTGVLQDAQIKLRFETEMDQEMVEENLTITPEVDGEIKWLDGRTAAIQPTTPLQKATKYTIHLNSGLRGLAGGVSDQEIVHEFETIGKIKVSSRSPEPDSVRVSVIAPISIAFDQEVDKDSAQSLFSISPTTYGRFEWNGNTMTFIPNILNFGTQYIVTLKPGIKSIHGIDSDVDYSFKFTTRSLEITISMPLYYQPQYPVSFSCNIYAAKMALAWKGYNPSIPDMISEIGYNASQDSQGRWLGNPYTEYVGNSDGTWGYGTYWTAIQELFNNRGIATEVKTGWNVADLAKSIENGNPVIIWRYNGTSKDSNLEWGTAGVHAINGQHGGVITGFRGTIDNPTHFYINDPWFGLIWIDRYTFDYYWSRLNRSSLIIY